VKVEGGPGLKAQGIGAPERLPYPFPAVQQEPGIGEVQMYIGDQVLWPCLESESIPQYFERLAVTTHLLEEHSMPKEALTARIAPGHLDRCLEREIMLAVSEVLVTKAPEIRNRGAFGKRNGRSVRWCGQREDLDC
jgi:hypothetical protein